MMSLSKVAQKCEICKIGSGIYSCPRCNCKYCSSRCYKSREHETCSEQFFREWVETSLQNKSFDRGEREKMMNILKRCEDEEDSDDSVVEELTIEDRLACLDINNADEDIIWEKFTSDEKAKFKEFIEDERNLETIIPLKQPWWIVSMLNLVTEMDAEKPDEKDDVCARPPFPLNVKKLSEITSKKPSDCIQYNLINILYSYAFLFRFYNCDLRDFLDDVVDALLKLSPVLLEGINYFCLEESVQESVRLISSSHFNVPLDFVKSIVNDVSSIMQGPNNAKPISFVLCALHDIKLLFLEWKCSFRERKTHDRNLKKSVTLGIKKIEYFMSWCLDNDNFSDIASELVLLMLPELFSDSEKSYESEVACAIETKQPVIEEIDSTDSE